MASVYLPKGRNIYRIEFIDQHGKYRKISSGSTDERVAKSLAMKIEEDAGFLAAGMPPKHIKETGPYLGLVTVKRGEGGWREFRRRFEAEYLSGLRKSTRDKAIMVFDVFEAELAAGRMQPVRSADRLQLSDITESVLSAFAAALRARPVIKNGTLTSQVGLAAWTIKNYLIALKTALTWAKAQKLIADVPAFPTVKVPKLKPRPIAEADWSKLLEAAPDALWRTYFLCGWLGGLRLSEARELRRVPSTQFPWLDLTNDRIILPAVFAKTDEDQWIPLHAQLRQALTQLPDTGPEVFPFRSKKTGQPLTRGGVTANVIYFAKRAGVKLSMHDLRRGFGCRVAKQLGRGNAPVLHRLMRHSTMQVTMDFYASVDDVLHEAIGQLDKPSEERPPAFPPAAPETPKGEP